MAICPSDPDPRLPGPPAEAVVTEAIVLTVAHRRRLREVWRSAGWPFQDTLEAELVAGGWLSRLRDAAGHETLRLTDAGVAALAETVQRHRQARSAHEALVERVACEMHRAGRIVWRGLSLRAWVGPDGLGDGPVVDPALGDPDTGPHPSLAEWATRPDGAAVRRARRRVQPQPGLWSSGGEQDAMPDAVSDAVPEETGATSAAEPSPAIGPAPVAAGTDGAPDGTREAPSPTEAADPAPAAGGWVMAMPDVYSIRQTSTERYLLPVSHEVKVRRADLLSDLRRPGKGEAYRWLAAECWYVIAEGIAAPEEIPSVYGVIVAPPSGPLVVARPAPRRAMRLPFGVWMALARARPVVFDEPAQSLLTASEDGDDPWASRPQPARG